MTNSPRRANNWYSDIYQPDTTLRADKTAGAFDDPQVLLPGIHGSLTPNSLRSNRGDGYSRLMVQTANVVAFPPGFSLILNDVALWLAASGFVFTTIKWCTPLMAVAWFPYVAWTVVVLSLLIPIVSVCLHRRELIPFLLLRLVLIGLGITIVY